MPRGDNVLYNHYLKLFVRQKTKIHDTNIFGTIEKVDDTLSMTLMYFSYALVGSFENNNTRSNIFNAIQSLTAICTHI